MPMGRELRCSSNAHAATGAGCTRQWFKCVVIVATVSHVAHSIACIARTLYAASDTQST